MVFLDTGFSPNLDFFEAPINITNIFSVEAAALSEEAASPAAQFNDIFVIGNCARKDIETDCFYAYNSDEARRQAEILAQFILEAKEINFSYKVLSEDDKQKMIDNFIVSGDGVNAEIKNLDKTIS